MLTTIATACDSIGANNSKKNMTFKDVTLNNVTFNNVTGDVTFDNVTCNNVVFNCGRDNDPDPVTTDNNISCTKENIRLVIQIQ